MELSYQRTFVPRNKCSIGGTFIHWNFRSQEPSFLGTFVPWNFRPKSEITMERSFPNCMIIILYGLNPKPVGLQASVGRIQVVTVMSCDPFNQRALCPACFDSSCFDFYFS